MPIRTIVHKARKNIKREEISCIYDFDIKTQTLQKKYIKNKNANGSQIESYGYSLYSCHCLDVPGKVLTLLPSSIETDMKIINNIKRYGLFPDLEEPLPSSKQLLKEWILFGMKNSYADYKCVVKNFILGDNIVLDKIQEFFYDQEELIKCIKIGKDDDVYNINTQALKWTGIDPDNWGRYYINQARYSLWWFTAGAIDYTTPHAVENQKGSCRLFKTDKKLPLDEACVFNNDLYKKLCQRFVKYSDLPTNDPRRFFSVDKMKFENE